jgi:hypothetical protein
MNTKIGPREIIISAFSPSMEFGFTLQSTNQVVQTKDFLMTNISKQTFLKSRIKKFTEDRPW